MPGASAYKPKSGVCPRSDTIYPPSDNLPLAEMLRAAYDIGCGGIDRGLGTRGRARGHLLRRNGQQDPACLLRAAKEALQNIPEGRESRAVAADHLGCAAQALADHESMLAARWEAFRAEPFPRRLLDLRDAARDRKAQDDWMLQVVTRACDQTGGLIRGSGSL
jgi:hypothetical protein